MQKTWWFKAYFSVNRGNKMLQLNELVNDNATIDIQPQ